MKHKIIRGKLYSTFSQRYGIKLTPEQLDEIELLFHDQVTTSSVTVGVYRFINFSLGICFLTVFFFLRGTKVSEWLFVIIWSLFVIYNLIHCWNNYRDYKRLNHYRKIYESDRME